MLIGDRGGLAASWVDHHQLAAAGADRLQPLLHIGHGHDAAIGGQRVAAEDQHEIGVIDIRHRQQQAMAVHQVAGQVVRQLVDRGRGEAVARFQQAEEVVAVGRQTVVMHTRVALVDGHGIAAVALADLGQALGDQLVGLVPADGLPLFAAAAHGVAQAIGVVLDVLQRHCLRTDMAAAEAVEGVALDRKDALAFGLDGQTADGFAQMTGTVMDADVAHFGFPHGAVVVSPL